MSPKINLKLIKDFKKTKTSFWIDFETLKIDDITMHLSKKGIGAEHEFAELALIIATIKIHPSVINYDWDICKSLFHQVTELSLVKER